ncbi:bacillithiol system redox-active protein YtxJ [Marinigracilibium pacificum]|uniref:Bacillithiol system redox-active protein YtxJ n=1 Tax=Marinigracilibium pacificum TaxID=2729599 RepID=A0A848IUM8_9BACT|nr:bacillithiol system redox-active protein YtxJ [Marinigracilibium pacificum]NMM46898.1 bacillithiol system redox-active protein YtxJ [Marinigracilibium pacificum]
MTWIEIKEENDLKQAINQSITKPVLIFKHSTRCSISSMMLSKLERNWNDDSTQKISPFFLDLIKYRNISNLIEEEFGIMHESPQALIIYNKECVFNTSHGGINHDTLVNKASQVAN